MTLTRQTTLLAWLAALAVAAVLAASGLAIREVHQQTRESEWAESTAEGVNQLRYLIMETALYREPRAAGQWRARMESFRRALPAQHYSSARENALLTRERENLSILARQYARLAASSGNDQVTTASVSMLFLTSQEMIDDAAQLTHENRLDLQRAQARAAWVVLGSVVLLAGLIVACFVIIRRLRLRKDNELGQLGHSFDRMTAQLEESHARMQAENAERRRAQEALELTIDQLAAKRSELTRAQGDLQSIIDHTPALVVYWDRELRNRFANRAYQDWFGLAPEQIRGMHVRDVIGAERYASIEPALQSVLRGNSEMFEQVVRFEDGVTRDMLLSYVPDIQHGQVQGFYGFISDISQLKLAQAGQAQALARLQAIFDAAIDFAIISTSLDGTIELFSRGAERLLGYRASEVIGHANLARFHRPEEVEALGRALSEQYGRTIAGFDVFVEGARHGQSESRDWTYVRRDGFEVEVSLTVTALRNGAGEPAGFLGVAKDIGRDRAILRALAMARDEAEAGSRAKTDFLANISHEIRTPMNAILGLLQMLSQTALDERQRGYADNTQAAARSLLRLLNDILDFSKVDAGKMKLEFAPFGLASITSELSALAASLAAGRELALRFTLDPGVPPVVMGDALRLRQVLLNLIGNAIKFTPRGEVSLDIRMNGTAIEFSVQDTGIGIAPEQMATIFDAFSQAEASTTRRFGGTGLGLAISQGLVQLMGATLGVSSIEGAGSRFSFALAMPAAPLAERRVARPAAARLAGLRLLVVDDNELNRQVAEALLSIEGAEVVLAEGGMRALQILRQGAARIDLVLMDVQMPGMDGHQATRAIRAAPQLAQLPVVAMTANAMAGDREACLAAGMHDYIEKPIDVDVLVDTVLRHSRGSACRQTERRMEPPAGAVRALHRLGGSEELFISVGRNYPPDARALAAELDTMLEQGDAARAARLCHGLRGAAGTVGADALVAFLAGLEAKLKRDGATLAISHERASLATLVEASVDELTQACAALEARRVILVP